MRDSFLHFASANSDKNPCCENNYFKKLDRINPPPSPIKSKVNPRHVKGCGAVTDGGAVHPAEEPAPPLPPARVTCTPTQPDISGAYTVL